MSLFQGVRHERSSPDQLGSKYEAEDRTWQGAALKTTVEQTCMGLSVSSARHCRSALVRGPAVRPCLGGVRDDRRGDRLAGRWSSRRKLVWGCLCQALVIAAPPWLEARPCGLALVGCVTIGGELALRGAGHRAANLYAVDPPGAKP